MPAATTIVRVTIYHHCFFFVSGWVCAVVILPWRSSIIENIMYRTRTIFAAATDVIAAYVEFPRT